MPVPMVGQHPPEHPPQFRVENIHRPFEGVRLTMGVASEGRG
jgi:hypothetical protein